MFVQSKLPQGFGGFEGELMIEPGAMRMNDSVAEAWLPHYFANWRGGSLVIADDVPNRLLKKTPKPSANTPKPIDTLLSYGHSYAFRVRLGDLSSGGPGPKEAPVSPAPDSTAGLTFQRMVPPKSVRVVQRFPHNTPPSLPLAPTEPQSITIFRPVIGYPEVLYTRLGDHAKDRATIVKHYLSHAAGIQPGSGDVAGLPDPDVERVRIIVEIRAPQHDIAGPSGTLDGTYRVLFETVRTLPALPPGPTPADPGLSIDIAYVEAPSIVDWASAGWPSTGALVIPRARNVQLRFEPVLRDDPGYFGEAASRGLTTTIAVRAELREEPALLVQDEEHDEVARGFLFRRPPDVAAPPVVAQFAQTLHLVADGLTITAPPGQRFVFGASLAIRHSLSSDSGAITFASESELLRNWIVAIVVDLDRDWTWDGLAGPLAVKRDGDTVGTITVPPTLGPIAVADPANWDRNRTHLVFFDAIDPHEKTPSGFPQALVHKWTLDADTKNESGPVIGVAGSPVFAPGHVPEPPQTEIRGTTLELTLPIAIRPKQVPQLASVGIALSPYSIGEGYAWTEPRRRSLWLELKEQIDNEEGDALFARVIGHGADPLLYRAEPSVDQPPEPPLVLDPELMRVITRHDSDDRAGIGAMTLLERATDSKVRYLLPLPPGIDADDPELFGFWTYELRVGHAGDPHAPHQEWWSTAQGRFGRLLRVNGVQHPAPTLLCRAGRVAVPITTLTAQNPLISREVQETVFNVLNAEPFAQRVAGNLGLVTTVPTLATVNIIEVTAPYATPVLNGNPLASLARPKTVLCFFLYAQVVQADGSSNRNVLLMHRYGKYTPPTKRFGKEFTISTITTTQRDRTGRAVFSTPEVEQVLLRLGLPRNSPLSVLAVELLPGGVGDDVPQSFGGFGGETLTVVSPPDPSDPLGKGLLPNGRTQRILRVSPLVPVAAAC